MVASSFGAPDPVLLWFAGLAVLAVWLVFRDPAFNYSLLVVGAVLPSHPLILSVAVLAAVMVLTPGTRERRRRWLALPIGMLLHLALDGAWAERELLWWPAFGWSFEGSRIPAFARTLEVLVVQELAGAAALVWAVRRRLLAWPVR